MARFMERTALADMVAWKKSPRRKPLVLLGARQVGKTRLLNEFARREYAKSVFLSLDRDEVARRIFTDGGGTQRILRGISALAGVDVTPGDTLVMLDEVQDCPEALTALKYLCEEAPDIHVAVAGSMLGLSLHEGHSYPVGKLDVIHLAPMDFHEFLLAVGKPSMASLLEQGDDGLIASLSSEYVDLLRQYYFVGGMPDVVLSYVEGEGLNEVRRRQLRILDDYRQDFSRHAPRNQVPRIRMVWDAIPSQLAKENKKFIFGALRKGARGAEYEKAIQWLQDSGLVIKVNRVRSVAAPLKFYEDPGAFKLFVLDVGLMGAMVDAPASTVLLGDGVFSEYKGAFTELFVCTQLSCAGIQPYCHSVEASRIELDFVVQLGGKVFPVEVKAEENVRSKSLKTFIGKHPDLKALRLSMKGHVDQGWVECIPLYACREAFLRLDGRFITTD